MTKDSDKTLQWSFRDAAPARLEAPQRKEEDPSTSSLLLWGSVHARSSSGGSLKVHDLYLTS